MPMMLADKKRTLWLLDGKPSNPKAPTAQEINTDGENVSCVVGNAGFNLGAGAPNTTNDGPLCKSDSISVPTSKTYDVSMNIFRMYDETGQIDPVEDFLFQAVKEFGSVIWVAFRDGGKEHDQAASDGDEVSIYELTAGGMGRATDTGGYQKRQAHFTVTDAYEDVYVGGTVPSSATS